MITGSTSRAGLLCQSANRRRPEAVDLSRKSRIPNAPAGETASAMTSGHGTRKALALMRRALRNHTERGGVVSAPSLGSGSTLIAAEDTGRICLAWT